MHAMQNIKVQTLNSHEDTMFILHMEKLLSQRLKIQRKTYLWLSHKEFNMFIYVWTRVVGFTSFAIFANLKEGLCVG